MTLEYRFKIKYKVHENGCWIWNSSFRSGYGVFRIGKEVHPAHRVSMFLYRNFNINSKDLILHKNECNNRACINPDHLYVGTHIDNMKDYKESVTYCLNGHEYTPENTYTYHGRKQCKICIKNRYKFRDSI